METSSLSLLKERAQQSLEMSLTKLGDAVRHRDQEHRHAQSLDKAILLAQTMAHHRLVQGILAHEMHLHHEHVQRLKVHQSSMTPVLEMVDRLVLKAQHDVQQQRLVVERFNLLQLKIDQHVHQALNRAEQRETDEIAARCRISPWSLPTQNKDQGFDE